MGNTTKLNLKLLVDTKNNKVLFAEAGKDFVDFLFHLMSLPVATIVRLVNATDMVGCVGELYTSIESLNSEYLLSNMTKHSVLNPRIGLAVPLLSLTGSKPTTSHEPPKKKFYICPSGIRSSGYHCGNKFNSYYVHEYVSDAQGQKCPSCSCIMNTEMAYVEPEKSVDVVPTSEGYVKEVVTYMVMDHLAVKPMSTISSITLINEFGVKDISSLAEKHVQLTLNEGIAILKASLETRDVLTTVFLGKKI
ncbi:uncharacterized protein LOC141600666 [Silene latifolia]|uniref:uncharacterized protein LOC141600666 n=1 Tax=Silene latifolia TaxID=37657 RepID=UPI003D7715D6